ncbi:MAG: 16S rRNA (guanine(966)-N(2))-methyltransferase RsmD [Eubacteriales bacterium]
MRIITGRARGTKLAAPAGDEVTRPTSERVKEAVFSMLQFDIEGRAVLDLFAGSGQLGLEAVSRGARSATFVERSRDALAVIRANIEKTKSAQECEVYPGDYADFIRRHKGRKFDIVFLDPPYAAGLYAPALRALYDNEMLKPTSVIVCESAEDDIFCGDEALAEKFDTVKHSKYSKTVITVLSLRAEA